MNRVILTPEAQVINMKITVNQLRRIIKEEVKRSLLLGEGMLDDSLVPKEKADRFEGSSQVQSAWFEKFVQKLSEKLKNDIAPELGKEIGQFLKVNLKAGGNEDQIDAGGWILLDDSAFIKAIQTYVMSGHKGSNELIDNLLDNYKPNEMKEAIPDLYQGIKGLVKKSLDGWGFTPTEYGLIAKFIVDNQTYQVFFSQQVRPNSGIQIHIVMRGRGKFKA